MSASPTGRWDQRYLQTKRWLLLSVLLLAAAGLLSLSYPVEELSQRAADMFFRLRGSQGTSPYVALVLIDDTSLARYGRWPWKRSLLAQIVRAASAERPKALGLDILLSETEDETNDRELANALKEAGNVVLVTKISNSPEGPPWVEPLPIFAQNAVAIGHAQAALDSDSICRSVPVRELSLDGPRWAFALEVARVARGALLQDNGDELRIGERKIPAVGMSPHATVAGMESESLRFLPIDYRGQIVPREKAPPFFALSVVDLLNGKAAGQLQDKAVLIGFASTEIPEGDRIPTPVSGRLPMPGVEVHANLIDAILAGRSLRPLSGWLSFLLLSGFCFGSTWVVLRWPVGRGLLGLAAMLAVGLAATYLVFSRNHILIGLGPFLCVGLLAGPLAQLQNLVLVDRDVTQGLRQLQMALKAAEPAKKDSLPAALRAEIRPMVGDLHWKVSLLRQLQAELSALYTFDETLLEAMQEGLAVFLDGRIVFRNSPWESFCERQKWDSRADLDSFARALHEPDWLDLRKSLSAPGIWLDSEVYLGEGLWRLRAVRLESSSGEASDLIMVVVTDQTARLERDRARAEALRFVTHELRTPLVSIQGFAEYLLRYSKERSSNDAAATIFREAGRLVAMLNTYLDVLRLEAGARPMRNEVLQIGETVRQVARVIQPIAQASEISIRTEIASDLPAIHGDPHLIEGAMLNLVSNAIKYSPRGSEVKLVAEADGSGVVLKVWNPGPAIPQKELVRLFEPFYRGYDQEETARGWGLGLAFVKRIAEQHGGSAQALSEPGSGTSFFIHLPVTRFVPSEAHQ